MADSTITRWLRAMNPLHKPADRAEAERSARSMALGLVLALASSLPVSLWMFSGDNFATLMDGQYATMGLGADEIAMQQALMDTVMPFAVGFGVILTIVLYGALAFAQWRYMTRAMPMILLALALYGLVAGIGMQLMSPGATPNIPLGLTVLNWIAAGITIVIYVAALQGAMMLHRLRGDA